MQKKFQKRIVPLKQGGIIKINAEDFEDLDPDASPEDILKYLYKKFMGKRDDEDEDDDQGEDPYKEDRTGYYI